MWKWALRRNESNPIRTKWREGMRGLLSPARIFAKDCASQNTNVEDARQRCFFPYGFELFHINMLNCDLRSLAFSTKHEPRIRRIAPDAKHDFPNCLSCCPRYAKLLPACAKHCVCQMDEKNAAKTSQLSRKTESRLWPWPTKQYDIGMAQSTSTARQ